MAEAAAVVVEVAEAASIDNMGDREVARQEIQSVVVVGALLHMLVGVERLRHSDLAGVVEEPKIVRNETKPMAWKAWTAWTACVQEAYQKHTLHCWHVPCLPQSAGVTKALGGWTYLRNEEEDTLLGMADLGENLLEQRSQADIQGLDLAHLHVIQDSLVEMML